MSRRKQSKDSKTPESDSTSASATASAPSKQEGTKKRRKPCAAASRKRTSASTRQARKQKPRRRGPRGSDRRKQAQNEGFRSAFEHDTARDLDRRGVDWEYEREGFEWQPKPKQYLPDFFLPNGVIVECKGKFDADDRAKHLMMQEQHPDKDIRILFQCASNKLRKGAKMTYGEWCDKHGIVWANKVIPREWLK